ncbi:MAG TPA: transcriptional regulator [Cyanobacteria bacterium UBA11166]|nr:transcriptional regulator [Cyanobacteria bacterium UBA11166]
MPKSVSYHQHRIEFLQNPEAAAAYIEAILAEKDPEPQLLQISLSHVAEALGELNMTPEEVKHHQQILEVILSQPVNSGVYSLENWLNSLGLKLTITTADAPQELLINSEIESEIETEVTVYK